MEKLKRIKFINQTRPQSQFDLIKIDDVFRKAQDHSATEFHIIDFFIILLFENGHGNHTIDFTEYQCSKGSVLTIRKDQIHKFDEARNLEGYLLCFTDEFMVSYLEELETLKSMLLFNEQLSSPKLELSGTDYNSVRDSIQRISDEYFETSDDHSLSIIRSELHILIMKLFRIKSSINPIEPNRKYLQDFVEFQTLAEANCFKTTKVKDYATQLGKSTKTLNTITQSIINKTAKAFIDEICTNQIKRLLINTVLSIKEIAYQAGFEETANFYKYFKRQTLSTPEKYRANHR